MKLPNGYEIIEFAIGLAIGIAIVGFACRVVYAMFTGS